MGNVQQDLGKTSQEGTQAAMRTYKDLMFRDIFGAPERKVNALALYNALNGSHYTDPDVLEVTTIESVLFASVRNDVSLLIDIESEMVLWEHQSTPNPNMPLRGLIYLGQLYGSYVVRNDLKIHRAPLVRIPRPIYFVFYNGRTDRPDREVLRLSDAYVGAGCIEVEAVVLNINAGRNPDLMAACEQLAGYARFVELAREYHEVRGLGLEAAFDAAASQCIEEGHLVEYLRSRWKEARRMYIFGYDFEELQRERDEAKREADEATRELEEFKREAKREREAALERERRRAVDERDELASRLGGLVATGVLAVDAAAGVLGLPVAEAREAMGL